MPRLRFFQKVMTGGTAQNTLSTELGPVEMGGVENLTYYIVFGAGTGAGAVQVESSPISGYTGTWAAEGSPVAWAAANRVHKVAVQGLSYVSRARISTLVTGGSVDIYAMGEG